MRVAGWVLVVSATIIVTPLTITAVAGGLSWGDAAVRDFVLAHRWAPLDSVMLGVSWLSSEYLTPVILAGVLWLSWRRGRGATLVGVGMAAVSTVWQIALKALVGRPRPEPLLYPIWHGAGYPSGHALTAVVLPLVLWRLAPDLGWSPRVRRSLAWAAAFWPLLVSVSRVYLNCHYLSDVVAGLALGWGHLGLSLIALGSWWGSSLKGPAVAQTSRSGRATGGDARPRR